MGFQGGTLYIYQLKNDVWTLENSFQAEDSNSYDQLGISLDLQGDILVAGAPGDNEKGPNMGSAYIFRNGATGWSTEAKVFNQSLSSTDKFGLSVALDNGVLAVGAPMEYYNGAGLLSCSSTKMRAHGHLIRRFSRPIPRVVICLGSGWTWMETHSLPVHPIRRAGLADRAMQ